MRRAASVTFTLAFLLYGCKKEHLIPPCITAKIEELKIQSCEYGASVKEYKFQGQYVYTFYIGFCAKDFPTPVLDASCKSLGSLGGFYGNTKINGVEFSTAAVFTRTIWPQ